MRGKVIYVLILVVFVQSIYPITQSGSTAMQLLYQVFYAGLLAAGWLIVRENQFHTRLLIALAVGWLISGTIYAFNQEVIWAQLLTYSVIILFQSLVTWFLLVFIFSARRINRDVIYAAVAIYFLLGAIFVPTYGIIETVTFAQTDGEHAFSSNTATPGEIFPWQDFIYFSYTTLTTAGYGDILPITMTARSAASLEAIIGVLYLTIVMARLVGLYTTYEESKD